MLAARIAAVAATGLCLLVPSLAHGHAWSGTRTLATDGAGPVSDMARSGHAIVGWTTSDGKGAIAIAAPGGDFVRTENLASLGAGVADVAIAENGDAFALWYGSSGGVFVATRHAGGTWSGGDGVPGGQYAADLAAGPEGDAVVVAADGSGGVRVSTREDDDNAFTAGPSGPPAYSSVAAGYVGDRVVIAGEVSGDGMHAQRLESDGTLGAPVKIDDESGPPQGLHLDTDEAGAGAILAWMGQRRMRAARAGASGAFGAGEAVSPDLYKGVMHPDGAIASDGRVLVGWGDAEFDPVALVAAASPAAPFGATSAPAVPGNRTDDLQLEFDSAGAEIAAWYFSDNAQNGLTGRVEVATRLPGQSGWCGAETLASHRANGYTLRLRFDGAGRGIATWMTPASGPSGTGSIWVSRYARRTDCPPTPPPPPAEEVRREEVVYLPPPPPPPVVTTTRRFVQLTLPPRATVDRRGRVRIPVSCSSDAPTCAGRLAIKRGRAVWGSRSFTVANGPRVIRLTLRRAARRTLAKRRRAAVTVELRLAGEPLKRAKMSLRRR